MVIILEDPGDATNKCSALSVPKTLARVGSLTVPKWSVTVASVTIRFLPIPLFSRRGT
jgi:hypothetical protein